jgi:hypothetical protein
MVVVDVNARDESYSLFNLCGGPTGTDIFLVYNDSNESDG